MSTNRRDFIKKSTLTAGVIAAPIVKSGMAHASPNDQINVAVVGVGGRGRGHIREFQKQKNVNVVAACDVDERLYKRTTELVEEFGGK